MKYQTTTAALITAAITLFYAGSELEARGGGRGGGGGFDRGGFDRTPSMSREGHPNQSFQHQENFQNRGNENRNFDNRALDTRAVNDFRTPNAQNVQSFLSPTTSRDSLHQFMNTPAGNLGGQNIGDRNLNGQNLSQGANRIAANSAFNNIARDNSALNGMFGNDFFQNHGTPYYLAEGANLARAENWNSMANWLSWGDSAPIYYDNSGYASTVPISTTQDFSQATNNNSNGNSYNSNTSGAIAQNTVQTNPDWMSLGTYALGEDATQLENSTMFIQLVLKKDGTIAGTYYNTSSNQTYLIDGEVNQNTQQAAWKLTDNNYTTLMKTGLYNLTQPQTQITVQFADGTTSLWQMLHMQN